MHEEESTGREEPSPFTRFFRNLLLKVPCDECGRDRMTITPLMDTDETVTLQCRCGAERTVTMGHAINYARAVD